MPVTVRYDGSTVANAKLIYDEIKAFNNEQYYCLIMNNYLSLRCQQIKKRDSYLCQICIREMYDTYRKYNCNDLQVHHAVPINASKELRLDDNNLITLCSMHHAMCDRGEISSDEVKKIISEQENNAR